MTTCRSDRHPRPRVIRTIFLPCRLAPMWGQRGNPFAPRSEIIWESTRGFTWNTTRGKPVAVLAPFTLREEPLQPVRPFAEAWEEIESVLLDSEPTFATVEEAQGHSRQRPPTKQQ